MWNQALRRVVHAEERHQEECRRQQLLQAAFTASSASNGTATTSEDPVEASVSTAEGNESTAQPATVSNGEKAPQTTTEAQYIDEDDEDYLQKHLLSSPTSAWSLLEDTQQANCLALNASNTLLAVGERDGRVTIWDNTTIRVITRELDPTLIALPAVVESHPGEDKTAGQSDKAASVAKTKSSTDAGDGDRSVENDDASAQDEDEVRTEDNASTADDAATATEEENDHESEETKTEDELDTSGGGVILTLSDLRVVKTSLKVVSQCEWSCDSRWLFVGCEEKSTRRARLCVWDVEAATLVSAFRFDGAINTMSAHPSDPKVLIVNYNNSRPVLLDVRSGDRTELVNVPLENTQFTQPAVLSNSRYAALVCCARYGRSGTRIYCVTSKSTMAVLDATTFKCIDSAELTVLVQFVDLSVNVNETALLITSSKGIHEFLLSDNANVESSEEASNKNSTTVSDEHMVRLREVAVHSTGAVRAPWAVCRFSGDEEFVVGTPVVRHLHVGENGLYTWHRASVLGRTTAQHNVGIKDGVLAFSWDHTRQSVLAVSTGGALHVREENFTTNWPGAMYPAGFRLVTDNELHLEVFDRDEQERKREKEKLAVAVRHEPIDVFTVHGPNVEFPSEYDQREALPAQSGLDELRYLPAIPIAYYHRRHLHLFQGPTYHEDKHFGLGQSVFEPLKDEPGEPKTLKSKSRKSAMSGSSNNKSQKRRRR